MSRQANDVGAALMLTLRGASITGEALQAAFREYLAIKNTQSTGKTTLAKLAAEAGNKLENIKISDKNIGDFTDVARKYNVSFALKRDPNTEPPTWFVFFKQDKSSKDAMERAFKEFADKHLGEPPIITKDGIKDLDIEPPIEKSEPAKEHDRDAHDLPDLDDFPEPEYE